MNDQSVPPPPNKLEKGGKSFSQPVLKIMCLFVAFVPSLVALPSLKSPHAGPEMFRVLLLLDFICSLAASIGIVRGMESRVVQAVLVFFLTLFFFVANVVIGILIGCSQIAPV